MPKSRKTNFYPECRTCLNREFDPFQCENCEDADKYEPEDQNIEEDISYDDFLTGYRNGDY